MDNSSLLKKIIHYIAKINFRISALNNVRKIEDHLWEATATDPQLLLKSPFFFKGWYFIQIKTQFHSQTTQTAKLYVNYGKGYNENAAFAIPHRHNRPTYKVIYLAQKVKSLRFDPVESQIDFTLNELKIFRIPELNAKRRILKRISHLHPEYKQYTEKELYLKFIRQSKQDWKHDVLSIYKETFSHSPSEENYQYWIQTTEAKQFSAIAELTKNTNEGPLISILLPAYNSNPSYLLQCIESVQKQSYQNWQLCIVDDASTQKEHIELLHQFVATDSRIQFQQRATNGHISIASNNCLEMSKGEYTLLLDHDDMLAEHTLLLMVNELKQSPQLQLIYADEDKINENGLRFEPHFKPEWNQDLLYSQNYIGHPILVKTQRLQALGGFRTGVEGSQDHDLLLRYTANLNATQIHRIPNVLYHWRAHEQSTAGSARAKNYTSLAGIKALQDHFAREKITATVSMGRLPNTYRVQWPIPHKQPLVTLMIPTHNGYEILSTCITSILEKTTYANYEIIIINNQADCPQTLDFIAEVDKNNHHIRVLDWNHPFNYSAINNFAAEHANGSILGLINNDIEVITPEWLTEMVSHAFRPEIGCVGSKLYYPNDKIQHAGVILGIGGVAGHGHKYFDREQSGYFSRLKLIQNYSAVTAACLLIRKELFNQVKGLDKTNLSVAFNDVDFCMRVQKAGYRNLWTPYAELYHHESISRGKEDTPEKQNRAKKEIDYMLKKWGKTLVQDPAYNPNLSLTHENFSIKN